MKFAKLAVAATLLAATPFAANAQDAGTTIYSQVDGSEVGTIISNDGTTTVLDTGSYEAPLQPGYFAEREGKWTINATKAQIDGMMAQQVAQQEAAAAEAQAKAQEEAAAKLAAALVIGAPVITNDEMALGMIDQIDGDNVVIKTEDEALVTLTRNFFAVDGEGRLLALASFETIMAAVAGG